MEYLIVVCSSRAVNSEWVQREIETFLEIHEKDKILTLLVDGEPEEAFPEIFSAFWDACKNRMTIFLTKRNNTKYSRENDCFKAFSLLYFLIRVVMNLGCFMQMSV